MFEKNVLILHCNLKNVKSMSTTALSGLRDYLFGTLSPANMLWLSIFLIIFRQKYFF